MNPSLTRPISPAWSRMVNALFRPFQLSKWLCMGFGAWLMTLTETLGNLSNLFEIPFTSSADADWNLPETTPMVLGVLGVITFFILALIILLVWLSARGRFIFLYQLISDSTAIQKPWREYREVAHSFFIWSLGLSLAVLLLTLIPAGGAIYFFFPLAEGRALTSDAYILGTACAVLAVMILIPSMFAWFYLNQFIAPIMFRYRCRTSDAWRFFIPALRENTFSLLIFPLVWAALSTLVLFAILILGLMTCCIGFFLLMMPYLGAVAVLPATFFLTGYSLEYLKSIGPDYDMFAEPCSGIPESDRRL